VAELDFHLNIPPGAHLLVDLGCNGLSAGEDLPQLSIYGSNDEGKGGVIWQGTFPLTGTSHLDLDLGDFYSSLSVISFLIRADSPNALPYIAEPRLVFPERATIAESSNQQAERPRPRTIVLIVEDACRRDFLSPYNSRLMQTPNLDEISRNAVVFTNAYADCSWTKPSFAAMFTGQPFTVTGVVDWRSSLPPEIPTMAELLAKNHWRTTIFTANPATGKHFGLAKGFEYLYEFPEKATEVDVLNGKLQAADFIEPCRNWLGTLKPGDNALLVLHLMDTHMIYFPPDRYRRQTAQKLLDLLRNMPWIREKNCVSVNSEDFAPEFYGFLENQKGRKLTTFEVATCALLYYCGAVSYFDDTLPRLMEVFSQDDRLRDAVFILCSDHGEEFLDHGGVGHGGVLYQEMIHVPLLVWGKGMVPRRAEEHVGLIDLAPTIMELAGVALPGGLRGRSLLPLLTGEGKGDSRAQFAATSGDGMLRLSVVEGEWKLMGDMGQLYNLADDQGERENLASRYPVRMEYLMGLLRGYYATTGKAGTGRPGFEGLDKQVQDSLRGLGYIQ